MAWRSVAFSMTNTFIIGALASDFHAKPFSPRARHPRIMRVGPLFTGGGERGGGDDGGGRKNA